MNTKQIQEELQKLYSEEDVIEGVDHKSLSEIIQEVAEEEGMTQEEVRVALNQMAKSMRLEKEKGKLKRQDNEKKKKKKKMAKQSRKKNR